MQVDSRINLWFSRYRSNIIQTKSAIQIPPEADIETAKSTYNNGILEIRFKKDNKGRVVEAKVKTIKAE
jgi:HSP20 family molecular chaperone IbpA